MSVGSVVSGAFGSSACWQADCCKTQKSSSEGTKTQKNNSENKAKDYKVEINEDFEEEHTGLADCMIEKDIFSYCLVTITDNDGYLW